MKKTEICILGVIHSLHKHNKNYTYEDIFKTVEHFQPDVIGIEIRPEDINENHNYLAKYYPYEMIDVKSRFEDKCEIYGFDWLFQKCEGKLLWDGVFDNKIKLENDFETNNEYTKEKMVLEVNDTIRLNMALNLNVSEINDGRYDMLCDIYYKQLKILFSESPYSELSNIYESRDNHIANNIINIIKGNIGKRILLLMGIDHRISVINSIKENMSENLIFITI